jgi:hypothetical protein
MRNCEDTRGWGGATAGQYSTTRGRVRVKEHLRVVARLPQLQHNVGHPLHAAPAAGCWANNEQGSNPRIRAKENRQQ